MLRQIFTLLAIFAVINLAFIGCEEKNPIFTDYPLQNGQNQGQGPDTSTSDTSQQEKGFNLAVAIYDLEQGTLPNYWTGIIINCYELASTPVLIAGQETRDNNIPELDDKPRALFENYDFVSGKEYRFVASFLDDNSERWEGIDTIRVFNPATSDWFVTEFEVKKE